MDRPPASPESPAVPVESPDKARELQHAFDLFNQVSAELTQAYEALQQRVVSLTAELAIANGELRRQYQEKEALSERLSLLLNALPAGVIVVDGSGRVGQVNPAALAMFGDELATSNWERQVLPRLQPTEAPDEWSLDTPGGVRRISLAESALSAGAGRILLIHDVTAAHDMKATMERNQRLAAMGELAASLAHQLRTPLSTALLYTGNLANPDLAPAARGRFAERASEQLKRLERLIQDVLLFARGASIGREVIAVGDLAQEARLAVEALCRARQVEMRADGEQTTSIIVGDRKALGSALVSLLENAAQVSTPGSTVHLLVQASADQVVFIVQDSGPGVSPELAGRIFEPFFTTSGQGTGLGLAIALGVARAHGGTIRVASRPDGGAEFAMSLPAGSPDRIGTAGATE